MTRRMEVDVVADMNNAVARESVARCEAEQRLRQMHRRRKRRRRIAGTIFFVLVLGVGAGIAVAIWQKEQPGR